MSFNSLLLSYSHFSDFPQILARLFSFFRQFLQEQLDVDIETVFEEYVLETMDKVECKYIASQLERRKKRIVECVKRGNPELARNLEGDYWFDIVTTRRKQTTQGKREPNLYITAGGRYGDDVKNIELVQTAIEKETGLRLEVLFSDF